MRHPHISDEELRVMRNAIYQPDDPESEAFQKDSGWEKVKDAWRNDAVWLCNEYQKAKAETK